MLKFSQVLHQIHWCQSYRSFSTAQWKSKQHLNIGTIGDESHGKTTLTQAILNVLDNDPDLHGSNENFNRLNKDKLSQLSTSGASRTVNFEFETIKRHYLLADNTGNKDHIGNMIIGTSQLECAVLVVSAVDGISHIAKQHLLILKHLQIPHLIVYLNKCDHEQYDPELQELIEMEVHEMLQSYDFDTDKVPFIRGSALNALQNLEQESIIEILDALDGFDMTETEHCHAYDVPFLLPMQLIHNIKGVGIAVIGKAIQGILNNGDNVELIGCAPLPTTTNKKLIAKNVNIEANVASLKLFDHSVKSGKTRDYLGIALHGNNVNTKNVKRGMYVVKQNKSNEMIKGYWRFTCHIEFLAAEPNACDDCIGKTTPIGIGFQPIFHFMTNDCTGKIERIPSDKNGVIMPGESVDGITVCLQQSAVIWKDLRFILREAGRTIGLGIITQPLDVSTK